MRRQGIDIKNEASKLIYRSQQALDKAKKDISKEEKKQIKDDISELQKRLSKIRPENMTDADLSDIRTSMQRLESSSANACRLAGLGD